MQLRGIFPPMATPFTADGDALDFDALKVNVDRWMATRLAGLVVLGSNGEAAFVDDDEAERLVGAVRALMPSDRLLLAGTGRESTRATVAACRRAAAAGAHAALVRVPGFFKAQMTGPVLHRHFLAVADACPVPVILYNFANVFGANLPTETVASLAEHPNIVGLKESGGDVAQVADQVSSTPDEFDVVVGAAPALYASLCVGASGGVVAVANVVPEACVQLYELTRSGRHDEARAWQRALTPLARSVTATYGVAGLKAAMTLAGYRGGDPRPPLAPAGPQATAEIARALDTLRAAVGADTGETHA
jgi:4-hydroxy-2-oxoglutarate aldolase